MSKRPASTAWCNADNRLAGWQFTSDSPTGEFKYFLTLSHKRPRACDVLYSYIRDHIRSHTHDAGQHVVLKEDRA